MIQSFSCDEMERVRHERKNYSARDQTVDLVSQCGGKKPHTRTGNKIKKWNCIIQETLPEYKHQFKSN